VTLPAPHSGPESRQSDAETSELRREVAAQIETGGVKQVRIATVDLHGIPRAKMVTAEEFLGRVVDRGHPWALPLIAVDIWQNLPEGTGYGEEIGFGNGVLRPDLRTFRQLPWAPATAHVFADVFTREGEPAPTPRQVLSRVLGRACELGFTPVFGNELEFYIFRPADESRPSNPGFAPYQGMQVWFTDQGLGQAQPLLQELQEHLLALGIPLYEIFNEHGGGQYEFNLKPLSGVEAIDAVCLMKLAVKEICLRRGLRASFLGKISNDPEYPVSGYHLHQSLLDQSGDNVFSDPAAPLGLSSVGRHYVGGVLEHAMALTALAAPTVTAYKRFTPGTWAPTRAAWGFDNRTAMIRVVPGSRGLNLENRLASSDANPYLLAAGMTAAGLEGIRRRSDPGEPGTGNLLEEKRFPPVPTTLVEAVKAFEEDAFMSEALGESFSRIYVALLRHVWGRFQSYLTDWEIQEYRELL
jgi:glutamine synthetase